MRADAEQQLEREIALLRQQLELAEEMRRAIVNDEVDAFVVGRNGADPKLVLLETARHGDSTLLEHVHEGAVTVSESGDVLYANRRFATMTGRSLAQLFGKPLCEMVAPEDRARFEAFLAERAVDSIFDAALSTGGAQVAVQFTLVSVGNGHASLIVNDLSAGERLMEAESALRAIRDGEIDGVVVAGEHVLLIGDAHRPYRALADRMEQGAATVSAQGDVLYANHRFASMVGVPREQLLGKPIAPLLDGDRERISALIAGAAVGTAPCELAIVRADGSLLPVSAAAQHLEGVDAIALVLTDLTEHNRHRAIEEEARRKDRFLAVLGHELRNPLASVRNAVEILKRRTMALGIDERLSVEVIGRQTDTLVRLLDDLLDIHRLNEDKLVLRREPVELASVIRNAIEAAQPYLDAKAQALGLALPDEPIFVHADAVRLVQVLLNLLSNATKFTAKGGRIMITLERVHREAGEEVARIRVADNGIGVAPELLDRIFDPYMQVAPLDENGGAGLGLGLSVARRLVALHGGSIRADSQGPGRGTTFTLELATCAPPPDVVANAALVEHAPRS